MKRFSLIVSFLILNLFSFSQTSGDDGYIIGFENQDSSYNDFEILRSEFLPWHQLGTVLDELYGIEAKELSKAVVICDKRYKVYEGWKVVSEIDLANPKTTIADGKDEFVIYVKYRNGGSENFSDQSSTITSNSIIINSSLAKDGVGEKIITVCYPSSKYENEIVGDLSNDRIYRLPMHEYPIFVNIRGLSLAFNEAKNLHSFNVYWDAVYINKSIYNYLHKKGKLLSEKERKMLYMSSYNLGRCYYKLGMYNKALKYFSFAANNSFGEKYYLESNFMVGSCLNYLHLDNSDAYDKIILHQQGNPKLEARDMDFVMKSYIERSKLFVKQKDVAKANEYLQKLSVLDNGKRFTDEINKIKAEISKLGGK